MTNLHPTLVPFLLPIWHMTITGSDYLNLAAAVERLLVSIISQKCPRGCANGAVWQNTVKNVLLDF